MKKLLSFSPITYLMMAAAGFALSVGGMWHQHTNQKQLQELGVLNQGISTCFNRVSQTFTATMIKDFKSTYLDRGFMALSDECLSEAIKGMKPFKSELAQGHKTLQKLISEVHWFHESVLRAITPAMAKVDKPFDTTATVSRFKKMEEFKAALNDEMEVASNDIRKITTNDQIAVTLGIFAVFLALVVMMAQENQKNISRKQIEARALSLLNGSKLDNSAIIDQLIDEGLTSQFLDNTAQLFRDYNGEILEKQNTRFNKVAATEKAEIANVEEEDSNSEIEFTGESASIKEVLVTIQNIHGKENINSTDVRDVRLAIESEALEQVMNAAITKLLEHKNGNKRVQVSNQVHSDRTVLGFFLKDSTFNVSELEFASTDGAVTTDLNLILLKEFCADHGVQWFAENKISRSGSIEGMNIRLVIKRAPKTTKKNLVSVVKGKKKDLRNELMN